VKIDSTPPLPTADGNEPVSAGRAQQGNPRSNTPSPPVDSQEGLSSSSSKPQSLSVNYHLAENGHKVYFQVIDENTGQVILQAPPEAILKSEEALYEFLQQQAHRAQAGKE